MFTLTCYERKYRSAVLDLLFYSRYTQIHLDWHDTSQWLDRYTDSLARLAWDGNHLAGCLVLSPPLNGACWVRIVGADHHYPLDQVFYTLWADLRAECARLGVWQVAILLINDWLEPYLELLNMRYMEQIITLRRAGDVALPWSQGEHPFRLRHANFDDLPAIVAVDNQAFAPPWQLQEEEIRQALRMAASAVVAIEDGEMIGYQISTRRHTSGHLARLAVLPAAQGRGVGGALLDNLIHNFNQRGIRSLTVNTQESNHRSQRLYFRYGFARNGLDISVWAATLSR